MSMCPHQRRDALRPLAQLVLGLLLALTLADGLVAQGCVSGPALAGLLSGDLGAAPVGPFVELACLQIRDDSGTARSGEIAFSGIPLAHTLGLTQTAELAVVGPGNRRVAAQFDVLSRWAATVDAATSPIRWLQVAVPAEVAANGTAHYSLRHYPGSSAAADPFAASISDLGGGQWRVETGLARFDLDASNPALIEAISIDLDNDGGGAKVPVYSHVAGAGPRLVYDPDGNAGTNNDITLDTSTAGEVTIDPGGFEIVENGPVKVAVAVRGHFVDAGGTSLCTAAAQSYQSLGFTVVFTFTRASRDLRLQFQLRNECSDASSGPWTDDVLSVREASWNLPFSLTGQTSYVGGSGALEASTAGFSGTTMVEQRLGTGTSPLFVDWRRRARSRRNATVLESARFFDDPLVAVSDSILTVAAQMPWMRYREPQALAIDGSHVSLRFVSERLRIGEGKGIWNFARVHLVPTALATAGQSVVSYLESLRSSGRAELERGLVVWPGRAAVNASKVFPSLGIGTAHTGRSGYLAWLSMLHDETVQPGGLWDRNKTYGSQYWPESGGGPFSADADFPNQSTAVMNYWDAAGAEALQFLASGEPKWLWDYSLSAYWVQAFLAYLNTGRNSQGNRAGLAVDSGGPGCPPSFGGQPFVLPCTTDGTGGGHWHRTGGGSDDYTYAMSIELGYALRPNVALRDRFAQAGQTVVDRYDPQIPEANREEFVNVVNVTRQVMQHFEMLANCAEFVPGARGQQCHDRLLDVVGELSTDNLAAGILCQGQIGAGSNGEISGPPNLPTQCYTPQQFMQSSLMVPFLHRFWSNYRHSTHAALQAIAQRVQRAVVESARVLYQETLEHNGGSLVAQGNWPAGLDCTLNADGTAVVSCDPSPDSDNNLFTYLFSQPQTAALFLMAHDLDPSLEACQAVKAVYDTPTFVGAPGMGGSFDSVGHFEPVGWWKGVSQMMQTVPFGLGLYDVCTDSPTADLAVSKSNNVDSVAAGGSVSYEITVSNNGPQSVSGATLTDVLDGAILDLGSASFTCARAPGAGPQTLCPLAGDADALAVGIALDIEARGAVVVTVQADVLATASGTLSNTATVAVPATVTDAVPGNDSGTDSDPVGVCVANANETVTGTILGTVLVEACSQVTVGPATIGAGAVLNVHAPRVELVEGLQVQGGTVTIKIGLPVQ